jgi:hypothetical protein
MAGEFLYIAAETLSRFLLEARAAERGITPTNLARLKSASSKDALRERYLRDEIFAGDRGALQAMHAASNGFEHGYMAVQDIRGLMEPVLERSMNLVRRSLIEAAGAGSEAEEILLGDGYSVPRALVPPSLHVMTGQLARKDPTHPAPGDLPRLELGFLRPEMVVQELAGGRVDATFNADVKALYVPDNVEMRNIRFGMRTAHAKPRSDDT